MKMNLLFVCMFLLAGLAGTRASELTFSEKMPAPGSILKVAYTPDANGSIGKSFMLAYYQFRADRSFPVAGQAEPSDDSLSPGNPEYEVRIDPAAVFVVFKVMLADEKGFFTSDDNGGDYWDVICRGKDKKPLRGANLQKALSLLGTGSAGIKRNPDYAAAAEFLGHELKLYPDNMEAKIGLLTLEFDTKKIDLAEYENKLQSALNKKMDLGNEGNLKAVIRALRIINENKKAEDFEAEYVRKYPASQLAEEKLLNRLSSAKSFDEFRKIALEYFSLFSSSQSMQAVKNAFINAYMQTGKTAGLKEDMTKGGVYDDMAGNMTARQVLDNENVMKGSSMSARKKAALEALGAEPFNRAQLDGLLKWKPVYKSDPSLTELENSFILAGITASRNELLIRAMPEDGDTSASAYFLSYMLSDMANNPASYSPFAYRLVFERAGRNLDDNAAKLSFLALAVKYTRSAPDLDSLYRHHYSLVPTGEKQFYYEFAGLRDFYKRNFTDTYKDVAGDKVDGLLKAPDETFVYLDDFTGKTLVIFFFSTWCGPCQAMFPSYEKLFLQYEKNDSVKIIGVDVWEHNDDREGIVAEMLKNQPVAFPVYLDLTDSLPMNMNVSGLPTILVIDKEGKLRFREAGFTNEEDFLSRMNDRIGYLSGK